MPAADRHRSPRSDARYSDWRWTTCPWSLTITTVRPAEAAERFASVPEIELVNVAEGRHLWVGENQTRRVLAEVVERLNPGALPLPTEWADQAGT